MGLIDKSLNWVLSHSFWGLSAYRIGSFSAFHTGSKNISLIEHYRKGHPVGVLHHLWHRMITQYLGRKGAKKEPNCISGNFTKLFHSLGTPVQACGFLLFPRESGNYRVVYKPGLMQQVECCAAAEAGGAREQHGGIPWHGAAGGAAPGALQHLLPGTGTSSPDTGARTRPRAAAVPDTELHGAGLRDTAVGSVPPPPATHRGSTATGSHGCQPLVPRGKA